MTPDRTTASETAGHRQLLAMAAIGLIAATGIAGSALTGAWSREEQSRSAVVATYERLGKLDHFVSSLRDIEIGQRGYLLTGDPAYLAPFETARETLSTELDDLQRLDWSVSDRVITRLAALARRKVSLATQSVHSRQGDGNDLGKTLMDAIRVQSIAVDREERAALAERLEAERTAAENSRNTVLAALLAGLAITLAAGGLLLWHVGARRRTAAVARANAALLRETLDNVGHGVALLDPDGRLLAWNAQLGTLLGVSIEDGSTIRSTLASMPGMPEEPEETLAAYERAPISLVRDLGLDGLCLEIRGQPGANGTYTLTYTDITERRAQEKMKNDFVSTVSHELRTPLTSIRGATGLLIGPLRESLPPRALELVKLADRNAQRLLTLVNDILDADKIESGKLEFNFASVDLNEVAHDATEINRPYAAERGIILALGREEGTVMVAADAHRLQQVMANLISNAAKFSPEGGIVTITVEAFAQDAVITVQDHGAGVPAEFRERIFGKFAQAVGGNQRQTGGSGLGLNISRAIVERHGGTIGFTSVPGDTCFRFTLPLASAATKAA